jgi:hypothetical protein
VKPCACDCGELVDARGGRKYVNERHKQRAYRARVQSALRARGLPVTLSLKTANAGTPTGAGNGDASARRKARQPRRLTPGQVRLSYPRTLDLLTTILFRHNIPEPADYARRELDRLLTDRQRTAVRAAS